MRPSLVVLFFAILAPICGLSPSAMRMRIRVASSVETKAVVAVPQKQGYSVAAADRAAWLEARAMRRHQAAPRTNEVWRASSEAAAAAALKQASQSQMRNILVAGGAASEASRTTRAGAVPTGVRGPSADDRDEPIFRF